MKKLLFLLVLFMPMFANIPIVCAGEGHDAGYEWAEENDIDDEDDCDGNSESFNEGCLEYVEEQAEDDDE